MLAALAWLLIGPGLHAQTVSTDGSSASTAPAAAATTNAPIFEQWAVLVMQDKQCGFASTITTATNTPGGVQYRTSSEEEFVVSRTMDGQTFTLKLDSSSKVVEDADGGVLSFEQETSGAGSDIVSSGTRDGDDLVVTSRGQTVRYHMPRLSALGPEKIRQLTLQVPLKAGQAFTFNTFDSDYPQAPVIVTGTVEGQETRNVRGTERKLWRTTAETNVMPGVATIDWIDDESNDVELLTTIPGIGDLHEYVTDRAECMKQPQGAEIFASTLVHPDRAFDPSKLSRAVFRITCADNGKKLQLWNGGEQKILSSSPNTSDIEVTVPTWTPADATYQLPHPDTPDVHEYLQPTSYLEVNSPDIQALAREAVGGQKNPVIAAYKIEAFVSAYISKKDLNVGFASAEETAKSREGDCTEHAVLCAALGRAAGLPTRCVLGLGYIPPGVNEPTISNQVGAGTGIFGFHMWAEALIAPDKWVPMDAALNGFDVGHIAIIKTALEEVNPLVDLNAPIFQLLQNLKIQVIKTVPKGAGTSSPPTTSTTDGAQRD